MLLKLPPSYSRTLVVIGRFRSNRAGEKGNGVFVFENGSDKASELSATNVFAVLKPELRLHAGNSVWCDNALFYGLDLQVPKAVEQGSSLSIGPNSVLLEQGGSGNAGSDLIRATIGGKLIKFMLDDLDIVARISGSNFPNALLELAHRYLNVDVNQRLRDAEKLIATSIDTVFRDDPVVTHCILALLLAFEDDVPGARKALYAGLQTSNLKSQDDKDRAAKIEAIINSVEHLRKQLETEIYDETWETIVGGMPWVADISTGDDAYKVELGDIEVRIGASLRDLYMLYRERTGRLHKLVRAPVLHSYIFMWLTSKYGPIVEGRPDLRADKMYKRGVFGVADANRIYGDTPENTAKRKKLAEDKAEEAIKKYTKLSGFEGFAKLLIPDICDVVQIENTFRRSDLLQRLKNLFVELSGTVSGPAASALNETRETIAAYRPVYQRLVNILNASEKDAWNASALKGAIQAAGKPGQETGIKAAVEAAQKSLEPNPPDESEDVRRERIRTSVLNAFIAAIGVDSINRFAEKYQATPGIADQTKRLAQLYDGAGLMAGWQDVVSDTPAAILTVPPQQGEVTETGKERLKQAYTGATPAPAPVRLAMPTSMAGKISADQRMNGKVKLSADKVVGEWSANLTEGVEINIYNEDLKISNVKLSLPDNQTLLLTDVDPQGQIETDLKARRTAKAERAQAVEGLGGLGEYAKKREEMRRFYVKLPSSPMSREAIKAYQRSLRTLMLGEILAAAPDRESRLGIPTISEMQKLLLDICDSIGDIDNPDLMQPCPDNGSAEALGPDSPDNGPAAKLNLSAYFRLPSGPNSNVAGPAMIHQSIVYHQSLTNSVSGVSAFLGDLADLKAIADAAAPKAKLIVINRTLAEYTTEALQAGGQMLTRDLHAATLYLSHAAEADDKAWKTFGSAFADNYTDSSEQPALLSCPMVISAERDSLANCPFPVASLANIRQLKLRALPDGQQDFKPDEDKKGVKPPEGHVFSTMDGGLIVKKWVGISVPAAMAAAAIVKNTTALGTLSPDQLGHAFLKDFHELVKMHYLKGEPIIALLRRLWLTPETTGCLSALAVSRIATLALMAGSGPDAPTHLKALLVAAQLAQGKDTIEEHDLNAAQKAVFDSSALPENARFTFMDGRTDVAQSTTNIRFFNRRSSSSAISLQVQLSPSGKVDVAFDQALCQPLEFLKV